MIVHLQLFFPVEYFAWCRWRDNSKCSISDFSNFEFLQLKFLWDKYLLTGLKMHCRSFWPVISFGYKLRLVEACVSVPNIKCLYGIMILLRKRAGILSQKRKVKLNTLEVASSYIGGT